MLTRCSALALAIDGVAAVVGVRLLSACAVADGSGSSAASAAVSELQRAVKDAKYVQKAKAEHKSLHVALAKLGKNMDKVRVCALELMRAGCVGGGCPCVCGRALRLSSCRACLTRQRAAVAGALLLSAWTCVLHV